MRPVVGLRFLPALRVRLRVGSSFNEEFEHLVVVGDQSNHQGGRTVLRMKKKLRKRAHQLSGPSGHLMFYRRRKLQRTGNSGSAARSTLFARIGSTRNHRRRPWSILSPHALKLHSVIRVEVAILQIFLVGHYSQPSLAGGSARRIQNASRTALEVYAHLLR